MNALIDQTHIGPDAELLALCSRLAGMQSEWQRLYWATSNKKELTMRIPMIAAGHSNRSRPPIPIQGGQGFQ